jgi:hypothetical protein
MDFTKHESVVAEWVASFAAALDQRNIDRVLDLFEPEGFWRDLVAFTWNIYTAEGRDAIRAMLTDCLDATVPMAWAVSHALEPNDGLYQAVLSFETEVARCAAVLRLREGRCWTLLTSVVELKGFEETVGLRRPNGAPLKYERMRVNWKIGGERQKAEVGVGTQPYCVIIGAGMGGLGLGARLNNSAFPHSSSTNASGPPTRGESGTRRSRCIRRSGTITCHICRSRRLGRGSPPKIRSPTGSTLIRRSWTSISGPARTVPDHDTMRLSRSGGCRSCETGVQLSFGRSNWYLPEVFLTCHPPLRSRDGKVFKAGNFTHRTYKTWRVTKVRGVS